MQHKTNKGDNSLVWPRIALCVSIILIALTGSDNLHADNGRISFQRLAIEQGLSQSSVFCILQDSRGFMWFGTEDGLNKYNGYEFKVYRHDLQDPGSLSDNWVRALYEDKNGTIWIGTRNGGLNRLDRGAESFIRYRNDPNNPDSLGHDYVFSICEDQSGALWLGTRGGGLNRFDRQTGTFARYKNDPADPIQLERRCRNFDLRR